MGTAEKSVIHYAFNNTPIDWSLLANAVMFYTRIGYVQIETPWALPVEYMEGTKPHDKQTFVMDSGRFDLQPHELVGSAEQGFSYLLANDLLPEGKYFSVTPCFRDDNYDATHQPWFLKLELFIRNTDPSRHQAGLMRMTAVCKQYFESLTDQECSIVPLGDTFDIMLNGVEVGSYGIKKSQFGEYIYGTGLALPRFTSARK